MAEERALERDQTLTAGTAYRLTYAPNYSGTTGVSGAVPPGLTHQGVALAGTPTTAGVFAFNLEDDWGSVTPVAATVVAAAVPVTPAGPVFDDAALTITLPEDPGVAYSVNGTPTDPQVIPAEPGTTYTVTAEALEGYVIDGAAEWTHTFPASDGTPPDGGEPPALTAFIDGAAGRVARMMGKPEHAPTLDTADMAVRLVMAYAEGYTRGRGWSADGVPVPGIAAVVTVAAVRLASNPRQVTYYQAGDYSERPAVMAGWTAAELGVLRRYRRVWA